MQGVDHYENFPVASWLCPRPLRAPIVAIYHFARTADDLADEGDASAAQRLADLSDYRGDLGRVLAGEPPSARWQRVFAPLATEIARHRIPGQPLHDLLDAFEQDVRHTAAGVRYQDMPSLLDYCRRSANPVGRLLLHLYGVGDASSLARSDAICSALQLINFWQDLGQDLARDRHYLPLDSLQRHGVDESALRLSPGNPDNAQAAQAMIRELVQQARRLMLQGAPLALDLPGRAGWELRLVAQGGLRICDRLHACGYRSWVQRPRLGASDLPRLLWRAVRMGRGTGQA